MTDRFELDLKTFEILSKSSNLVLLVTSKAYLYDVPFYDMTQEDLIGLIKSKQLWLPPQGLCRLDVHVQLHECDISGDESADILDFIAQTICQSSLWSRLGLIVEVLDVQYHQEVDGIPNLYFKIDHPDMSYALLSPPHTCTAHFKGLECLLRFQPSSHPEPNCRRETQVASKSLLPTSPSEPPIETSIDPHKSSIPDLAEQWKEVAYLVEAVFYFTIGVRKRFRDLKIVELETSTSLLEIAPAIWNSHYLKSSASHAKNFAVISNILASTIDGQSPELRRKGAELLKDNDVEANEEPHQENESAVKRLESSIQRSLWDLLQATLKLTVGTTQRATKASLPTNEMINHGLEAGFEISGLTVDEDGHGQHSMSHKLDNFYGYLLPLPDSAHKHYQSSTHYLSDFEYPRPEGDNSSLFQNDDVQEALELGVEMENSFYEAELTDDQLPQPYYERYFDSLLPSTAQDLHVSDYLYRDNIRDDYEYDHLNMVDNGYIDLEVATSQWEDQGRGNTERRAEDEDIAQYLDADEDGLL
ncbi:hypothetical protein F5Y19DRAFT_203921 [Xylariaceae sp. FL1651]|nr:hypothetical protein F5Y19DRAFT_203921 [Xylariaceae sp. FL1651]